MFVCMIVDPFAGRQKHDLSDSIFCSKVCWSQSSQQQRPSLSLLPAFFLFCARSSIQPATVNESLLSVSATVLYAPGTRYPVQLFSININRESRVHLFLQHIRIRSRRGRRVNKNITTGRNHHPSQQQLT